MLKRMSKLLVLLLVTAAFSLVGGGCKSHDDHPSDDHPKAEHPEGSGSEHPKSEHPE